MARETLTADTIQTLYRALPHLMRLPSARIWTDYDAEADVLYISLKRPQKATDTQYLDEEGVLLRYHGKELVGVTILDASKRAGADK